MDKKRKVYAPFSLTSEAGVAQTPVEGYIDVNQAIYPTVNTGVVNENGKWTGVKSSDEDFRIAGTDENIANGGEVLVPVGNESFIDMTGFRSIFIAIKVSRAGNYGISAIMGPDTESYANLTPINAANVLRGAVDSRLDQQITPLLDDGVEVLTADVWDLFYIDYRLAGQKLLQFKLTNNSGGASDIQFASQRIV